VTARDVRAEFARWRVEQPEIAALLDAEALRYLDYHAARYAKLLTVIGDSAAGHRPRDAVRILDVGPNIQTVLLRRRHPDAVVDTLGFAHPAARPRPGERHIPFDLNDAASPPREDPRKGPREDPPAGPRPAERYDLIVLAEVAEHLHTPLSDVLRFLVGWAAPSGLMIVQTPNGAALHKRLRLLRGRSPVEPPRSDRENPGHLHEYTLRELRDQVAAAGLRVERLDVENLFGGDGVAARAYRALGAMLPPTFRHGVTLCVRGAG
jgi:hypothetical protein